MGLCAMDTQVSMIAQIGRPMLQLLALILSSLMRWQMENAAMMC